MAQDPVINFLGDWWPGDDHLVPVDTVIDEERQSEAVSALEGVVQSSLRLFEEHHKERNGMHHCAICPSTMSNRVYRFHHPDVIKKIYWTEMYGHYLRAHGVAMDEDLRKMVIEQKDNFDEIARRQDRIARRQDPCSAPYSCNYSCNSK